MKDLPLKINKVVVLAGLLITLTIQKGFAQCSTPTNLVVSNVTSTTAYMDWSGPSNATSYVLKIRQVGSSTWRRITSSNSSETVTGLLPNSNYEAKVRSDCYGVEGNYTSHSYFSTVSNNSCNLPLVYYFTSNNITANSCRVGWRTVTGATSYNVRYKVRYSGDPWMTGTATTNYLQLNGLNPHTLYEFQVQTVCPAGTAAFSTSGIFTTQNSFCQSPSGLSVSNVSDSTADLMWSALPCAAYYRVEHRTGSQAWAGDTTSSTNFTVTNLTSGTSYDFRVQGIAPSGSMTAFSQTFPFNTSTSACGQTQNLTTTNIGTNGATLEWDAVVNATSYNVRYKLAGASTWQSTTATTNTATISGLSPDNAYEFEVQSVCSSGTSSFSITTSFITLDNVSSSIPVPDHIVICILENKAFSQLIGSSLTPRINAYANDPLAAVFTESYGKTHPSQPNYLHFFSGGNQGVTDNSYITTKFTTPNLAAELLNANQTFVSYSEGLPSVGYDGPSQGKYRRRHNPVANWMGSGTNQVPATLNRPLTDFPSDFTQLPTVSMVVPDLDNSMHDGTLGTALATGDSWLYNKLNAYIQWAKTNNSLFILTTDEDDGSHSNRVLTLMIGEMVNGGDYNQPITHYSVLRTIEEMYGLNFIGGSANSTPIQGCWTTGFRKADETVVNPTQVSEERNGWKVYPNPSRGEIHIAYELLEQADVAIRIYNSTGALIHERKFGVVSKGKKVYDLPNDIGLSTGVYFATIRYGDKSYVQRFLISE